MAKRINKAIEKQIIDYYQNGFGVMELSKQFQVHRSTIQRAIQRNNLALRKRTPCHYDIHFFDTYNIQSCYWAGFIAADGYVRSDRNTVALHLSVQDREHLEKLAVLTKYTGQISSNKHDCCLSFNGEWFVRALSHNFNIHPQKTYNIELPAQMPDEMIPHFLRGYFDGDGCITPHEKYWQANFTSGSNILLQQIADYMYEHGIKIRNASGKAKIIMSSKSISYGCANALKVLKLLYQESTEYTRLTRKYRLYQIATSHLKEQ